jgi:hypothetical protein
MNEKKGPGVKMVCHCIQDYFINNFQQSALCHCHEEGQI